MLKNFIFLFFLLIILVVPVLAEPYYSNNANYYTNQYEPLYPQQSSYSQYDSYSLNPNTPYNPLAQDMTIVVPTLIPQDSEKNQNERVEFNSSNVDILGLRIKEKTKNQMANQE